jgi:hypothetical protein
MQGDEVSDVVCDEDPTMRGGILQEGGVGPSLLVEIVDTAGIDASLPQLRRQVGIDIFVK